MILASPAFLQSCVPTTKINGSTFCPAYLKEGDRVLLGALPSDNSDYHFDLIQKELKRRDVTISYAPQEDWNLRASGISNPLDTTYYKKLLQKGITHLLIISESSTRGDAYTYMTPFERSLEQNPYNVNTILDQPAKSKVEMLVKLISFRSGQVYAFQVSTNVGGLQIKDNDGGQTTVNPGGLAQARNVAIRKVAKRIVKYCK